MNTAPDSDKVLEIRDLQISFSSIAGTTRAVNGVSLDVRSGEIVGLVGESGCGKSVTIRSIVGLVPSPPALFEAGEIWLRTRRGMTETLSLHKNMKALRQIRGRDVSMIFQEPMRSVHPMMTIGKQITEGILEHEVVDPAEAYERTVEMLDLVGLPNPAAQMNRYAHELSGGMRQRALIALALVCHPQLLLADEPTTALDVTIQAQILELIRDLRERMSMSVLLITHNMGVVANLADRISVMYLGKIMETGTVEEIFKEPAHPYTQGLLASMPSLFSQPKTHLQSLRGVVPELAMVPKGCVFADRCPYVMPKCDETPPVVELRADHSAACWLYADGGETQGSEVAETAMPALSDEGARADPLQPVDVAPLSSSEPTSEGALGRPSENDVAQLQIENVALHYPILRGLLRRQVGTVRAVDGVDLTIRRGETLGLVGESGCGKTSVGRLVARLVEPTAGRIRFGADGGLEEITHISQKEMKRVRRAMGMVFQDPLSSLNARMNIRNIVGEPLMLHQVARGRAVDDRVGELLEMVGLRAAHQSRFPHAFSGGQRQRIAIARALATEPSFLVADEPVSALDVSVQAQILNLLLTLQQRLNLSMLFIAHDIAVVRHVSDRIAVMYLGKIVELGEAREICVRPVHPYTEALLASIPLPMPGLETLREMPKGDLPDPANPPTGCRFHTRCPYSQPICEEEEPPLRHIAGDADHFGACHFQDELYLEGVEEIGEIQGSAAAKAGGK
ncbi:MAG: ABC transporter ATP-binding protein [Caldilineaceae bacterium SB0668_bin_21]|nr:ABC transporter ATP-binding protein [Caldilineaceae bacterium SB0668_bin_21]MYC24148.1 ABC transporter ATP-binding protein [Caldilineaceae bacterium SB0662_bin_25]